MQLVNVKILMGDLFLVYQTVVRALLFQGYVNNHVGSFQLFLTGKGTDPVMNKAHHFIIANEKRRSSFANAIIHNRVCFRVNFSFLEIVLCASVC